ncbi:MAG: UDP-N-acetylmuramoyl-L-alanine--D-glutamate ligase [Deltaproteobacteria bacterium CG11_big_fil_rev_8_21_14_0_20_47_16]|nr:MAG: UDP-N-acetylmuramoyl-L-alanine--D-glutamate ligase [Deltaproteobacteria bacterium CG11_big_fil_rev_8_21_14_0_20_47_16]
MNTLANKNVLVVGFGKSGQAAARYCAAKGAHVVVSDSRSADNFVSVLPLFSDVNVQFEFGGHAETSFQKADLIVASPGVPMNAWMQAAQQRGVSVVSDVELGLAEITAPIVAITGTNGKSTTTALVGHLLSAADQKVCVAGNIGISLLDALDEARAADVVVLEMSSYQLEITPSLKPKVAIYLNLSPDHLDRYQTMEAYAAAKSFIFQNQDATDAAIYNANDPWATRAAEVGGARKLGFDVKAANVAWSLSDTVLVGEHNYENALAAVMAAKAFGIDDAVISNALKTFKGLPHRLQLVRELKNVRYYDDSKGTNIGAVQKSLAGFTDPVHLIAGGIGKGTRYTELRPSISAHVKTLILMGQDKGIMMEDLGDLAATYLVNSMREAVVKAHEVARAGEVVLLSPACASFDMFRDYADRGNQFVQCVKELVA